MRKNIVSKIIAATVSVLAIGSINAATPHYPDLVGDGNRWTITAYHDSSSVHNQWATQGLCFYYAGTQGTQQLYTWVSDTFPDWNGRAVQEGDQIFMHGDYAQDVGHDGMVWEVVTSSPKNEGYGHWKEWREDGKLGNTIGFVNAKLQRVGKCESISYEESVEKYRNLELKTNKKGELIVTPNGLTKSQLIRIESNQ